MSTLPERLDAVEATIEGWRDGASVHGDWERETLCRVLAYLLEDCARARGFIEDAHDGVAYNPNPVLMRKAESIIVRLEAVIGKGER